MKKCLIGICVSLFVVSFSNVHQAFAHYMTNFNGTIKIEGLNETIHKKVTGQVTIDQWGHDDSGGNFEEALFDFKFKAGTTECGDPLKKKTVRVSSYRENKYKVTSKNFPLDLSEDGMAIVIERILNKYSKVVQESLELDECVTLMDDHGTTSSGKIVTFANAHISDGKAIIKTMYVKVKFQIKPKLSTFDEGYLNKKEYPLIISGTLTIPREGHTH
ncbi:MAG: hypothetical protein JETT_2300 [Candidatus Jettenia ecosi]|uniref:Lipid/polyisoprenoid-binding YceI-like domain-containing protein n=1 Tax=Candidatus Jettenia ecosi TaxID=2494326 RepID=A0A533Q9T5_9BACT|nr:MAG: hypothetical protein JETT_2300 [Candidatus Jettenia ecosi]